MIGVDHPGPENTEEHNEGDKLVDGPEDVASDVGDTLLNVIIKLSDNTVTSDCAVSDQTGLNRVILKLKSLSHSNIKRSSLLVRDFRHMLSCSVGVSVHILECWGSEDCQF